MHGLSDSAVRGGASGVLLIEGMQALLPAIAGLPQRVMVFRDQIAPANTSDDEAPSYDVGLNYVPIPFALGYPPVQLAMQPGAVEVRELAGAWVLG